MCLIIFSIVGKLDKNYICSTKNPLRWSILHNDLICSLAHFSSLYQVHFLNCVHKGTICVFVTANVWQQNQNINLFFKKW